MASKDTYASTVAAAQALIAGTQKHTPDGQLTFGNASYASASLVQTFTGLINAITARTQAAANAKVTLTSLQEEEETVKPIMTAYRKYLLALHGNATAILADYGLTPAKPRKPLTGEKMVAMASQNKATRTARGTLGPAKKLAIKGVVAKPQQPTAAEASEQATVTGAEPAAAHAPTTPEKPAP